MKAALIALGSTALVLSIGCTSTQLDTGRDDDKIREQLRAWPSAAEAGDVERYLSFVTDDVLMLPPNETPLRGKQQLAKFLRGAFEVATFDITLHPPEELVVTGDWAYVRYRVQMAVNPKSGGANTALDRKYLDIWRRGADGIWRAHRHMWNDNPASSPAP